tara:strand:+ start:57 stop:278 length:222 start_codon:yes stop_codon:yes gene_type:complete
MPSKNPTIVKAFKDGTITKGQYDKLSDGLLLGIIKKKKGTKKGKGTKEVRHKMGKEAHKRGRPKGGSKVEVKK